MDLQIQAIEKCAHESHAGLLTFPQVLSRLIELDVESYHADYRHQSTTYYLSDNQTVCLRLPLPTINIPAAFNEVAVVHAIRGAQSDTFRYPKFLELTMAAGCIGYIVWISGRHVSYFGRQGDVHIERFPN
jgi:uncharacterized protein YbcV (DUF1398 family)